MNPAQVHLALNHLPLFLVLIGAPLLTAAVLRRSAELRGTASVILFLAAVSTIPVYLSGEPTEHLVKNLPGVVKHDIHEHEEAAKWALIFVELLGALALAAGLFERLKGPVPTAVWVGIILLGIFSFTVVARTAHLGGLIRHGELKESVTP